MKLLCSLPFVVVSALGIGMSSSLSSTYPQHQQAPSPDVATYPADVLTDWLALQLQITQTTPAAPPVAIRRLAYTGVALYEALVPGMTAYESIAPRLNGLTTLPAITPGVSYHWPSCANAALATIFRALYPMTSPKNKAAIDSLEAARTTLYQSKWPEEELTRSADFGKRIAIAVSEWAKTDGYDNNAPYALPTGAGKYVLTPPNFSPAALCNWGQCRPLVKGSDAGTDKTPPIPYSEDPASAYYAQVREVYELSQHLTPEQKAIALFWADDPDGSSFGGGHWMAILHEVLTSRKPKLDMAARAYAQLGITCAEATFCVFKGKYKYNGLRPITYIRTVMKQPNWNTLIVTPPHPEYPSGHALISGAAAQTLSQLFGASSAFTDSCYTFRGYGPRAYTSFGQAAQEAADSRVYGGIHYRPSCNASLADGRIIARNVAQTLRFMR
ncbi:vanadium-dependent haloperoxidase [Spirosoma koreense]